MTPDQEPREVSGLSARSEDEGLRRAILEELDWDALVDAAQLDVTVEDGVVTVVGTVSSVAEKVATLQAIEAVAGVHDVVVGVDVKVPSAAERTDADLHGVVAQVLTWDALVPEQDLTHRVADGVVTLGGTVPTERQRQEAERAVGHLMGVAGVTNEIRISDQDLSPGDVRGAIGEALRRRAAHSARHIDVTIDGPRITLSGSVQTPGEKRAILGAVSHAPGVELVCDELAVGGDRSNLTG
jgi:osmotically-inducible protein OsmY